MKRIFISKNYFFARRRIRFRAVDEYDRIFNLNEKEKIITTNKNIFIPYEEIVFHNEVLYHVYEID